MVKKYRLITFNCYQCGQEVKVLFRNNGNLQFSILDKLYSVHDVLSDLGYYVCISCNHKSKIKFNYIFS